MPALAAGGWHHTPARAGSTSVFGEDEAVDESHSRLRGEHRELLVSLPRDHPRIRGEHDPRRVLERPTEGPSPHARGAHYMTCEFTSAAC